MTGGFELRGKKVLVVGLARTGIATARFCLEHGATVTAIDSRGESELGAEVQQLRAEGVILQFGAESDASLLKQDLVIPSPGVPADAPLLKAAQEKHLTVWSEIELADRFLEGRLVGITGSNGKTTTTSLVHHILQTAGFSTLVAGNIGTPMISRVALTSADTITVAELSSFQLELIETFHPDIAVLLNLTPDHLDRHKTMEAYAAAKARIFEKQTESDFAVLNADDRGVGGACAEEASGVLVQPKAGGDAGRVFARGRNCFCDQQAGRSFADAARYCFAWRAQSGKCAGGGDCGAVGGCAGGGHC